ncbi:MAG: hypothetical protein JXQ72_08540 [Anaerolineae bacterium]|nr:hypothetical protein [Anaerolineae bacterium]
MAALHDHKKNPIRIGIWGTPRAGKTTYLAMLYHTLLSDPDHWDVQAGDMLAGETQAGDAESSGKSEAEQAQKFVEQAFRDIFTGRTFPEKTVETRYYNYTVQDKRGPTPGGEPKMMVLEFQDAPGELYEAYYHRDKRQQPGIAVAQRETGPQMADRTPQDLFDYLKACNGLLLFIDPAWGEQTRDQQNYGQLLYQLFEDLRAHRRKENTPPPKVALCLVKVDGADELWNQRNVDEGPRACYRHRPPGSIPEPAPDDCADCPILNHVGWQFMVNQLPGLIPKERVKCFTVSSIGRIVPGEDEGEWLSNVGMGHLWQRPLTPTPRQLKTLPNYLPGMDLSNLKIENTSGTATFEPRSICDVDKIKPYNLLAPILWLLEQD